MSFKCTYFPFRVKGLYRTESYSLHVMQLVAFKPQKNISGFHTLVCWVAMAHVKYLIANPIDWL